MDDNKKQAIIYIILASLFFGIINFLVKYLSQIPSIEIVFFRSLVTFILSGLFLFKLKMSIFPRQHFFILLMRGLSGALALILYFSTIQSMPLGSAVTILYLAPVFTIILAGWIVKEKAYPVQYLFLLFSLVGAALLKSFDSRVQTVDFLMGLSAAFFAALAYNMIRLLKGKVHHQLIIFYFPLVTLPLTLPFLFKSWVTPTVTELVLLLTVGVSTQIAQVFMTKAYMLAKASQITHYNYLTTIYAFACGILFFNEKITLFNILGVSLVLTGVLLNTHYMKNK